MSKGYVYILSNPAMPGLVKIGRTTISPEARAAQLQSTGVPMPFNVECSVLSPDCADLEENMHAMFEEERVSGSREFFKIDILKAERQLYDELHAQLECFVDEFIPDHIIIRPELTIDPSDLGFLCTQLGEPEPVVVSAMLMITPDELRPFILRYYDKIAKRKEGLCK